MSQSDPGSDLEVALIRATKPGGTAKTIAPALCMNAFCVIWSVEALFFGNPNGMQHVFRNPIALRRSNDREIHSGVLATRERLCNCSRAGTRQTAVRFL